MIGFIIKKIVSDPSDYSSPSSRRKIGALSGLAGIIFNLLLFTFKMICGVISGSISITADALNNLSDAASSIFTLAGYVMASRKADREHPFGHGRYEYLAGVMVSILILGMGFELTKSSVIKIFHPEPVTASPFVYSVLCISVLVKLYMYIYNTGLSKLIGSSTLKATALDSISDVITTSGVIACTYISDRFGIALDAPCGFLIGLFILWQGVGALKETISPLLGAAPNDEIYAELSRMASNYPDIFGIHDLLVHDYGPGNVVISFHAEVPSRKDIGTIHRQIDAFEHAIAVKYEYLAVIHMDPVDSESPDSLKLREEVEKILSEVLPDLRLHDFRIEPVEDGSFLICFDLELPYSQSNFSQNIKRTIDLKIRSLSPLYYTHIDIDYY